MAPGGRTSDLFDNLSASLPDGAARGERVAAGAVLLRGFAAAVAPDFLGELDGILASAPWRHMITPGGKAMSVAMTNCGRAGWVSDRRGYRYDRCDPETGRPWPPMPAVFAALAEGAAAAAGFIGFTPDVCLINCYRPGARMALHQDKDERNFTQPIVSVSLGLPAIFLFGGGKRADGARRIPLLHGDVIVWGGEARHTFHGIAPLAEGRDPRTGDCRFNLTFRRAL